MSEFALRCPVPISATDVVQLAHGGGGRIAQRLIESVFIGAFSNPVLDQRHDAAVFDVGSTKLAMTTDGFVVSPWRFPGGDIGSLAVHGTVNDLAMAGARPVAMSASFIIEEGFAISDLKQIVASMSYAANLAGASIVTGDTKVVGRGNGDGVFIAAAGIGEVISEGPIGPTSVRRGDAVILSGDVGRHGIAVVGVREGLDLNGAVRSDSAAVHEPVLALLSEGIDVHCLRDVTRGGLATILNEIARDGGCGVRIDQAAVPVADEVASVCEILGLDPLYVACEGRFVAFVPQSQADHTVEVMKRFDVSARSKQIGTVTGSGRVTMTSLIGVERVLDLLSGEQLPRIC